LFFLQATKEKTKAEERTINIVFLMIYRIKNYELRNKLG
jgi:hypothetical protein